MHYSNPNYLTGEQAAELLGVSRRTIYRWIEQGRIVAPLMKSDIETRMPQKRPRGPKRNPRSIRYTAGRHTFRSLSTNE
jgi:predicted site-specific integrase-resolvase